MKIVSLFLLLLLVSFSTKSQILVFTYSYNRPDFIEIQYKTLKKFLLDEYEFIVFNDASDPHLEKEINETCSKLEIKCIRIPQIIHSLPYLPRMRGEDLNYPTVRNVNVVQYSLNKMGFAHTDIVMLLDSDLFLVKPFSAREFLHGYCLGGAQTGNGHVSFLWHALAILDMKSMPNKESLTFNCGRVDGHPIDGGGHSYFYIKNNPDAKVRFMNHSLSESFLCELCNTTNQPLCNHNTKELINQNFNELQIQFLQKAHRVEFFHDNTFLHYKSGTNWNNKSSEYHLIKTKALNDYITALLN